MPRFAKLSLQLVIFAALFYALNIWQTRNLLPDNEQAPDFNQITISGIPAKLSDFGSRRKVLYFYAPWCSICKITAGALEQLDGPDYKGRLAIVTVGLSYNNVAELSQFMESHNLEATHIAGDDQMARDYRIQAFPTLYILDENNRIVSQSIGLKTRADLALLQLSPGNGQ
jgi:peroxiredoxin